MIVTAAFHGDSGLILFRKIEWSNKTMFMVKYRPLFKNITKTREGEVSARGGLTGLMKKKIKAMMELNDQVFSSLPQRLTVCRRLYCI